MSSDRISKALDALLHKPPTDRYQEGYDAGFVAGKEAGIAEVLDALATRMGHKNSPPPTHAPSQPREQAPTTRLTAPNKDQLVRQYLTAHPGARYRDLNRELPPYVATRVYKLIERGEVQKTEDGRFFLISPN